MTDEYRKLKEYPNYRIYSNGIIYSERLKRNLRQHYDSCGYRHVTLYKGSKTDRKTFKVHVLVAKAFLENPYDYKEINHKDGNKDNNDVSNLEWCSRAYNVNYDIEQRRISGQKSVSPLTEEMVKLVPDLVIHGCSIKLISQLYRVGHITIRNIIKGKRWKNLNLQIPKNTKYNRETVYLPSTIYNKLLSFNIDNTVLNKRIKELLVV